MPSKKRKYNARFPAGRIKKIMQTDEEVGKVAQAVPIIICVSPRTLELFVESLLGKALQVTTTRNAKTLSPSHVKQCILGEARFDFLKDLVKNIPDVSAAEEKEFLTGDSSPNSASRLTETPAPAPPRRIAREDSNSSSSSDVIKVPQMPGLISIKTRDKLKRVLSQDAEVPSKVVKIDPGTSVEIDPNTLLNIPSIIAPPNILTPATIPNPVLTSLIDPAPETAIDLSKKEPRPVRTANFYHETFTESMPHSSVIKINPIYTTPQPSTSYTTLNPVETVRKIDIPKPSFERHNSLPPTFERRNSLPRTPVTPITPLINIDFSKNISRPEIKLLDATATAANIVSVPLKETKAKHLSRQNSKSKIEAKKEKQPDPVDIDRLNSGNLQIDEDYDT